MIHIAVEGERTEVDYIKYLRDALIDPYRVRVDITSKRYGMKPLEVVRSLLDIEADERWALFDRDEHTGISDAFALARQHDIKVAFSHPSFDLWLLLHFSVLSGRQSGSSLIVHQKLRQYPGFERFGREGKRIQAKQISALRDKHVDARRRARQLIASCPSETCSTDGHDRACDPLGRDPSTDVWTLLDALGIPS